ncbi:hypothetical protein PYW08_008282 [Mythimna loreyi]|uniref:Uncharacterized protein n=1 Tax=Mythimna loreyi TaxID=667449 RepID=A0ACC2QDM5_9NEOP|nr:hypothetical protein PYW08_008282 [Mythimna loreyi]
MKRALSLKKAGPSKNQRSVADFFKNATNTASQKLPTADKTEIPAKSPEKSFKRKASSPIFIDDDELEQPGTKVNLSHSSTSNTPKKIKTENGSISSSPPKISPKKQSPNKENVLRTKISPKKNLLTALEGPNRNVQIDDSVIKKEKEKPLFSLLRSENTVENHVPQNEINGFQKESCVFGNGDKSGVNMTKSPKKSPLQEVFVSPDNKLSTPEKTLKKVISPTKSGTPVKVLDLNNENVCNDFEDDWDMNDFEEDGIEDLDLTTMQHCEIISAKNMTTRIELRLKNSDDLRATCFVEGIWLDTPLLTGDTVSVLASRDSSGHYSVTNTSGLIVLRPDHLVSSTSVVAGVFCKRKAVLQERFRGIDSANMAMTTGILIHELVQKALTQKITSMEQLRSYANSIIKESVERLYDAGLSEEEARNNIYKYVPPLADFMNTYVADKPPTVANVKKDKNNWSGHIDKILDIEENLCCPKLGLKGKIDATVQVTIHERNGRKKEVVPLELKSGKASMSAEHRGQLVLYGMMLNLQNCEDPTQAAQRGLLLYLKDRVELREVSCGYPERRDLVMLRNQLVQYLTPSPQDVDPENLVDIEEASVLLQQKLPEPVDHHNACAKCPYLTLCSLHLWHTNGPTVSEDHPLSKLQPEAMGHLSSKHIEYFLHWTALLKMEERGQMESSPLHALWTDSVEKRVKRGTCAANLKLTLPVTYLEDRYLHIFHRNTGNKGNNGDSKETKGPQEGEFSIVSIENRPWIAAGVVTVSNSKEIHIYLERDVGSRLSKDTVYHIDTYVSHATTVQNLTNLGVLMEDSDRSDRLRKLIIDKESPEFDAKLPREVGRLGTRLMKSLNIQQQRAVLKSLAAKHYALMCGLPGTGKTQTISVLIQMLVGLKQRVLVTAHTHSAVDTVLCRLPESLRVLRLGSSARIAPALEKRSEQTLTKDCDTPDKLAALYDSMDVVGVTCLGATHAMLSRTTFDVCIVDEATQVLQSTVLRPLFAAKRFVLVGDPEQLPPVVRSRAARRLGMEESLFHRLMRAEATSTLQLQYRMNQALADVANEVAYSDRLKCANQAVALASLEIDVLKVPHLSDSPWLSTACSPEPQHAALFLDVATVEETEVSTNKNSCANPTEACVVIALVDALKQGNVKSSDIGVIAPYRDQVFLLRRALTHLAVEVSTVDQFQGKDKSVIIYSCTRRPDKNDDKKVKEGEVLNDQRRLAVSVTRAKHKLVVVGNSAALRRYSPLQKLIQTCTVVQLDQNIVNKLRNKYQMYVN